MDSWNRRRNGTTRCCGVRRCSSNGRWWPIARAATACRSPRPPRLPQPASPSESLVYAQCGRFCGSAFMGRKIIALLAGLFAAVVVILLVEAIAHQLVSAQRGGQPTAAMLGFVALAWFLGCAGGAFLAQRIDHARLPVPALLVGAILMAMAIVTLVMLPHPAWFRLLGPLVFLPGTIAG